MYVEIKDNDDIIRVSMKWIFFWRDFWLGFYLSDEEPKLVICIFPMFPIVIEWEKLKTGKASCPYCRNKAPADHKGHQKFHK
jgi:hypothetical protein